MLQDASCAHFRAEEIDGLRLEARLKPRNIIAAINKICGNYVQLVSRDQTLNEKRSLEDLGTYSSYLTKFGHA